MGSCPTVKLPVDVKNSVAKGLSLVEKNIFRLSSVNNFGTKYAEIGTKPYHEKAPPDAADCSHAKFQHLVVYFLWFAFVIFPS